MEINMDVCECVDKLVFCKWNIKYFFYMKLFILESVI